MSRHPAGPGPVIVGERAHTHTHIADHVLATIQVQVYFSHGLPTAYFHLHLRSHLLAFTFIPCKRASLAPFGGGGGGDDNGPRGRKLNHGRRGEEKEKENLEPKWWWW